MRNHLLLLSHLMFALQDRDFRRMLDERAPEEVLLQQLQAIEVRLASDESRPDNDP